MRRKSFIVRIRIVKIGRRRVLIGKVGKPWKSSSGSLS